MSANLPLLPLAKTIPAAKNSQSGNVFFYIFVAVALLGALSFAVSQSARQTGKGLIDDRAQLAASEIISYGDTVAKAAGQMRLRGIKPYQLSFAHPRAHADYGTYDTRPTAELFNPQGGGVIFHEPPILAGTGAPLTYNFVGAFAVENVGLTGCTPPAQQPAECSELLLTVAGLNEGVCRMLNDLLDISDKDTAPPIDDDPPTLPRFAGNAAGSPDPFTYTAGIGDDGTARALTQRTAGCFKSGDTYVYYQVLIAR